MFCWMKMLNHVCGRHFQVWHLLTTGLLICACNGDSDRDMKPGQVIMPAFDSTDISDNDDIVLGFQPDPPVTVTCTDGIWNGTETDVDCGGGACYPCEPGQSCVDSSDCVSGSCVGGACQAASCTDGLWNGTETDIDCGGDTCEPCEIGLVCTSSSDCASGFCANGVCQEAPVWTGPVIVPWLESGIADDDHLAMIINGMVEWHAITNTVIVSAAVSQVAAYSSLRAACPSMDVIPGLKTSSALYAITLSVDQRGFDSVEGWLIAAASIREMINRTGQSVVLLENETSMKDYVDGTVSLDFNRLREGLRQLPQEVTYLWYPSAAGRDELLQRYLDVDAVVEEVLDVRFIDHASLYGPLAYDGPGTINAITRLEAVVQEPTMPMIYALNQAPWWLDSEIPSAVDYVESKWGSTSWAIVYTGQAHWVDGAASITQYLLEQMLRDSR